ncbi:MAG: hypothetical protein JXA07_00410 [Spirochaetes bacterium]|nr:hypothetical protein [Spirochaetota bacterium]
MKSYQILFLVIASALLPYGLGCSLDPERRLNKAIDRYVAKAPDAERDLADTVMEYISIDSIEGENLESNGKIIYSIEENEIEVVYPVEISMTFPGGSEIRQIDMSEAYFAMHDGLKFCIFGEDGGLLREETVGDDKNPVRALVIDGSDLIYYKNSHLYRYRINDMTTSTLIDETFPPPYLSYYTVQLYAINDRLCILAGIAGSYYFSIVNPSAGSIDLKNLKMSSSKHHAGADAIFYIAGSSGNWELIRFSRGAKNKKTIRKFSDIKDIELTATGCLWENSDGLWAAEYGKEETRVPFTYIIAGKYKGRILLQYGKTYHFIQMDKMLGALAVLKDKASGLWDAE